MRVPTLRIDVVVNCPRERPQIRCDRIQTKRAHSGSRFINPLLMRLVLGLPPVTFTLELDEFVRWARSVAGVGY